MNACTALVIFLLAGLFPHRSGSMGFFTLKPEVRTLNDQRVMSIKTSPVFEQVNSNSPTVTPSE